MAITNGYATVADFTTRSSLSSAQITAKTSLIEAEIERNSREIDRVTGRIFYSLALTASKVRFDMGMNAEGLRMSEDAMTITFPAPILTITSITNDGTALVVDEDYYVNGDTIFSNTIFTTNRKTGVVITGTCGYAATPKDVNEICLAMTEVSTGLGTRTVVDANGDKFDITRDNMPDWVEERLYRRVRFDNCG
jgi:hypothetical protein